MPIKKTVRFCIMLKKRTLWLVAILLALMTTALAQTTEHTSAIVINQYGIGAPFLVGWTPIWFLAFMGGIGSLFFKIEAIDKHFRYLLVAKPFLGVFGSIALCMFLASDVEPQKPIIAAYAFVAALLSAPLLQGLLMATSLPRNQAGIFNSINPFKFKIVVDDKGDRDDTKS